MIDCISKCDEFPHKFNWGPSGGMPELALVMLEKHRKEHAEAESLAKAHAIYLHTMVCRLITLTSHAFKLSNWMKAVDVTPALTP